MLPDGIVAFLLTQAAITGIVNDRIQPIPAPEDLDQYPLITYQSPSDIGENANDGPVGIATMRIVFDCLAQRYLDARNLARALRGVLDGYAGDLPDGTHVELTESVNLVDRFDDGSRIYCVSAHWLMQYRY
jgi:hypothetical protein